MTFNDITMCCRYREISKGDSLLIWRTQDYKKDKVSKDLILVKVAHIIETKDSVEFVFTGSKNDYFNWQMYMDEKSWVWRVWHLGDIRITNITNTTTEFPR